MAHKEQIDFFLSIKRKFPERFKNISVLDAGSLDVNGNNRYLFRNFEYMGVDIRPGNNVDIVCPVHKLPYIDVRQFDVVISSEMLEHDIYFEESLKAMLNLLKTEGLLMISTATIGRIKHDSNGNIFGSKDYKEEFYQNITVDMLKEILNPRKNFMTWEYIIDSERKNLYFWAIKK